MMSGVSAKFGVFGELCEDCWHIIIDKNPLAGCVLVCVSKPLRNLVVKHIQVQHQETLRKIIRVLVSTNDLQNLNLLLNRTNRCDILSCTKIVNKHIKCTENSRQVFDGFSAFDYTISYAIREGNFNVVMSFVGSIGYISYWMHSDFGILEAVHYNYINVIKLLLDRGRIGARYVLDDACCFGNYQITEMVLKNEKYRQDINRELGTRINIKSLIKHAISNGVVLSMHIPCEVHPKRDKEKILRLLLEYDMDEQSSESLISRFPEDADDSLFGVLIDYHIKRFGAPGGRLLYEAVVCRDSLIMLNDLLRLLRGTIDFNELMLTAIQFGGINCVKGLLKYVKPTPSFSNNLFLRFALLSKKADIALLLLNTVIGTFNSEGKFICDRGTITTGGPSGRDMYAILSKTETIQNMQMLYKMLPYFENQNRRWCVRDFVHYVEYDPWSKRERSNNPTRLLLVNGKILDLSLQENDIPLGVHATWDGGGMMIDTDWDLYSLAHPRKNLEKKWVKSNNKQTWTQQKKMQNYENHMDHKNHKNDGSSRCQKLPKQKWGPTKQRSNRN